MKQLLRLFEWLRRDRFERDLDEELRHHLAIKAEASGEAETARRFGNLTLLKEESRAAFFASAGGRRSKRRLLRV